MTLDTDDILGITSQKPDKWYIVNDAGTKIAWFDSLDTASCVLRYLDGKRMPDADIQRAHEAMQMFDDGK